MGYKIVNFDVLVEEIKQGSKLMFAESIYDSNNQALFGTERLISLKDIERIQARCPDRVKSPFHVKTAIIHYIEEDKRVKWGAAIISIFESTDMFKPLEKVKKDFVTKYFKTYLVENDYIIWKLSLIKSYSKKVFDHTLKTTFISILTYYTYCQNMLGGMVDAKEVEKIIAAGFLHDVGMLTIDKNIIEKKRLDLSNDEEKVFYMHSENGFNLLKNENSKHDFDSEVLDAILCHEEFGDGTGCPRGIKSGEMNFLSKLMSFTNYYEIVLSGEWSIKPRTYREIMGKLKSEKVKFDSDIFDSLDNTFRYLYTA